jgi:hypothetical protein
MKQSARGDEERKRKRVEAFTKVQQSKRLVGGNSFQNHQSSFFLNFVSCCLWSRQKLKQQL